MLLQTTVTPGEYVLGRSPQAELFFEAELVSRQHARLTVNFDHLLIEDLGSANGTSINGRPVSEPTRLWPNQKVQIGTATLEFRRLKTIPPPDVSLAPSQAAVQRLLPEEFLREKKYDIGKVVAQGGMGAILDAREATIERRVAMKVMLDGSSPDDLARFIAEAKITGQLEHPSIVPIYELSVDENGQVFYTMKMVRGVTLRKVLELLAEGVVETVKKYPLPALLTIFQKVCDALAFAHSKGVIHRDLKPENIMLDDFGVVLVMDWGLAKQTRKWEVGSRNEPGAEVTSDFPLPTSEFATLAGTIMGTPAFMSPEQARGEVEDLDTRSDIYALGAILYQILALRPPVTGRTAMEIVEKVARGEIEPLECGDSSPLSDGRRSRVGDRAPRAGKAPINRRTPQSLAAVVRKAMAFDRDKRYGTVEELQRDLAAYQNGFATSAEKAGTWKQFTLFVRRNKTASIGLAAVLLVGATLGTKAVVEGRRAEREAAIAKRALADLMKTAPALFRLARAEAESLRFDRAEEALKAGLALEPQNRAGLWQRAWIDFARERYADAARAISVARENDPENIRAASLLPTAEQMASAAPDAERFSALRIDTLRRDLPQVDAGYVIVALSSKLKIQGNEKLALVRTRLEASYGKSNVSIGQRTDGTIAVDLSLSPANSTVEPLRGLPIDHLMIARINGPTAVADIEPLRGLRLMTLNGTSSKVLDIASVAGMPLVDFTCEDRPITNLAPLRGAPLRKLNAGGTRITDCSALQGMPLEELVLGNTAIRDLKPLHGAPIRRLSLDRTLVEDLSPLIGMPLNYLIISATKVRDLSPLVGLPVEELLCDRLPADADVASLLELPKLRRIKISRNQKNVEKLRMHPAIEQIHFANPGSAYEPDAYRPAVEAWAAYDAHQAAGKK